MIKIIKEGRLTAEHTCLNCGCKFTYESEDIKRTPAFPNFGMYSGQPMLYDETITCPCCNQKIYLKAWR